MQRIIIMIYIVNAEKEPRDESLMNNRSADILFIIFLAITGPISLFVMTTDITLSNPITMIPVVLLVIHFLIMAYILPELTFENKIISRFVLILVDFMLVFGSLTSIFLIPIIIEVVPRPMRYVYAIRYLSVTGFTAFLGLYGRDVANTQTGCE